MCHKNKHKAVYLDPYTSIASGNNLEIQHVRNSKYFSQPACAREHLHLYLYRSGFSSKACNYIISQFCSAAYQTRHYSEAFEEFGPALMLSSFLFPSPSALPLMLARGAMQSVSVSQASPPCLILSAKAAHSCGLHPQQPC